MWEKPQAKLWHIKLQKAGETISLFTVSQNKPILVFESYFAKLRRMVQITPPGRSREPVFFFSKEEKAEVEKATEMFGFKLKTITEKQIILQVENPENEILWEVAFFSPRARGLWTVKYFLARDKKKVRSRVEKFRPKDHRISVKKAIRMGQYPIEDITKDSLFLRRVD